MSSGNKYKKSRTINDIILIYNYNIMTNFWDLVNIEEFWEKRQDFNPERWEVSFYCKDCQQIVEVDRPNPKGYIFVCKKCEGQNIAIWTEEWIKERYHIK
jgi:DNA replicative helicase MCM subunit Mcm2 (Cdc46/Mcm family)